MRLGLFSRLLFTFRLHSDSIRARSGHPSNAHTPRIQSESFVSRHLKLALPFSRHSFETQGLWSVDFFRWFGSPQPVFVDSRSTVVFFCLLISGPIFCHFFSRRTEVFGQNTGCLVLTQRGRRGREGIPVLYHEMHGPTADCVHRAHHVELLHGFPPDAAGEHPEQQPRGKCRHRDIGRCSSGRRDARAEDGRIGA